MTNDFNIAASTIPQKEVNAFVAAAANGDEEAIRRALEKYSGRILNAQDNNGEIALTQAAWAGHFMIVALLLDKGADPQATESDGTTALMWAAWGGNLTIVTLLLRKGALLDTANNIGNTALIWAARRGQKDTVELLLKKGADIGARNGNGHTALSLAERNGHPDIAALIRAHELERDVAAVYEGIKEEINVSPITFQKKHPPLR